MDTRRAAAARGSERIDYASTLSGRAKATILAGVLLGLFLAAVDQTIVATALPRMVADLRGLELLPWISAAYLLASTAVVPVLGKLSDLVGRRRILLTGIVVFLGGSVLCGVAPTMPVLVGFRAVQGLGAAALTSTAFSVPADLFVPAERARYQGIFGAVFGLSSIVGPFLGGLLTDHLSWRWVFFVNVPLGAVAFAFVLAKMPPLHSGLRHGVDWLGATLVVAFSFPLLLALTLDRSVHPWGSPLTLAFLAVAAAALALLVSVERRVAAPVVPLALFRNRTFALISPASAALGAILLSSVMFIAIFLVNVVGVSTTSAGATLIPLTLSMMLGAVTSGQIVQRTGRWKPLVLGGLVLNALGLALLARVGAGTPLWRIRLDMLLVGLGLGPAMPNLTLAIQNAVPFELVGVATASRQFFQQLGAAVGVAVFGALLTGTLVTSLGRELAPLRGGVPPAQLARAEAAVRSGAVFPGRGTTGRRAAASDPRVTRALERAYTDAVTAIYRDAAVLPGLAFLLLAFVPELPLRRSNRTPAEGADSAVAHQSGPR